MENDVILKVDNLKQHFKTGTGKYKIYNKAVDGVSFEVRRGEVFSLVGESGCGKTTTGRTIIKIYKPTDGEVHLLGKRIVAGTRGLLKEKNRLGFTYQENIKLVQVDNSLSNEQKAARIAELKEEKKQRRREIVAEIKARKRDHKSKYRPSKESIEQVKVESKEKIEVLRKEIQKAQDDFLKFKATAFQQTDALPKSTSDKERHEIHAEELEVYRKVRSDKNKKVKAMEDEIVRLSLAHKFYKRPLLNRMQMIFQDPIDSLDPRMSVKDIIAESLYINGIRNDKVVLDKVYEVLKLVGLQPDHADHYPHEFSGGQRQRIGIARAIIAEPQLIIADEPISALDVSIQAQVINLLNELRHKLGLTILFIAHDLSVVKFLSDRIAIMYFGKIVEMGSKERVFNNPVHPYTLSLISAIPMPDPEFERLRGENVKYDPRVHDYSVDQPTMREIEPDHFVYANDAEFKKYQAIIANKKAE
ncbi:oligopeptide transport system ATP-binding protein [Acholeplasma morum]|uniref:ATP-binding cassette domain-containing protein n=1 Tax=Paracholeplasma morum TaxID=264637 RepID=UPI00195E214A|nr:ATP-binding cassette domain-containing protein [Paracholeplasma morum]MBM7453393.1 oligopeptide transport system ATP-binding protein [Paracholeplasma morum]